MNKIEKEKFDKFLKEEKENKMNLTEKEKLMIENIISNEYDEGLDTVVWGHTILNPILRSLIKKNLVEVVENKKDENVIFLTESGKKVASQVFGEKYDWL